MAKRHQLTKPERIKQRIKFWWRFKADKPALLLLLSAATLIITTGGALCLN